MIETHVQPGGFVAAAHVHPSQSERFSVVEGTLGAEGRPGEADARAAARSRSSSPARRTGSGTPATTRPLRLRDPAGAAVRVAVETMFALAADGKTNRKGMPNPFRLAVIAKAHFDTVRLPVPAGLDAGAGLAVGAPLGRLLGYEATYEPEQTVAARPCRRVARADSAGTGTRRVPVPR